MVGMEKITDSMNRHAIEVSTIPVSIAARSAGELSGCTATAKMLAKKTTVFGLARSVTRPRQKCLPADLFETEGKPGFARLTE